MSQSFTRRLLPADLSLWGVTSVQDSPPPAKVLETITTTNEFRHAHKVTKQHCFSVLIPLRTWTSTTQLWSNSCRVSRSKLQRFDVQPFRAPLTVAALMNARKSMGDTLRSLDSAESDKFSRILRPCQLTVQAASWLNVASGPRNSTSTCRTWLEAIYI